MSYPTSGHIAGRAIDYELVAPEDDRTGGHQLARLNKMIADLAEAGGNLADRIGPILEPPRPQPGNPDAAMAKPAWEPSQLEADLNRLQDKITDIRRITDRVIL